MSDYANTVKDVSRAIATLDEFASYGPNDRVDDDWLGQTGNDIRKRVASNLAYQFAKHNGWGGRGKVTTRDVRAALIAHGATPFTVEHHARAIAAAIRADFTDGAQ